MITRELKRDGLVAVWAFCLANVLAVFSFAIGYENFGIVIWGFQLAVLLVILPIFIYQLAVRKAHFKLALFKALASYMVLMQAFHSG